MKYGHVIENIFNLLKQGNAEEIIKAFAEEPDIDTPLDGAVTGRDAFRRFVAASDNWMNKENVVSSHFATTEKGDRRVDEFRIKMEKDGQEIGFPVAIVTVQSDKGIKTMRVYHATEPLIGYEIVRSPSLEPCKELVFPDVIDRYFKAIARTDVETVMTLWEEDGYLVGWGIPLYVRTNLMDFFAGGDIPLKHCTVTFDGVRCAVEYILEEWGPKKMPAQQGVVVYELSENNKMRYARIYDNITPPDDVNALCEY